jgi:hypothetical protein
LNFLDLLAQLGINGAQIAALGGCPRIRLSNAQPLI